MIIRTATKQDLNTLYAFEQGIIEAERPFDPTLPPRHINYYDLEELVDSSDAEVVVAERDGLVIGSGYARVRDADPYLDHTRYAYLGFMYVLPGHRGAGVNKAILDALVSWAHSRQLKEIRLQVYSGNDAALRAYVKAGFEPHLLTMRLAT